MKENLFKRTSGMLTEAFQNCLKRFPVTVCFVLALTAYIMYMISENVSSSNKLITVLGYYLSIGSLLSFTLHLWGEETSDKVRKIAVHAAMHVLLIADTIFLYTLSLDQLEVEIGIAHGAGILALGLSVFFLSFTKEKNDIPSWNFALHTISSFAIMNIIGYVMSGGICLLIYSLHILFGVNVEYKCYLYVLTLFGMLLPVLLFLGMLPKGEKKHNKQLQSSNFFNGIIHFLFLPLIAGYLIVLYIYAARILINWELPIGWVSWLVVALMAGCIAIEIGLYPSRIKDNKPIDQWIARWLPAFIIPLLLLMTVGIIRRFNDYGITINRLYLITLNAWFYFVCIGLCITKARRIYWISISFAIIFLITSVFPVNYTNITQKVLHNDIEAEIKNGGKLHLPLSNDNYRAWLETLPKEKALEINDKMRYMDSWFGWSSVSQWVEKDIYYYQIKEQFSPEDDIAETESSSYSGQSEKDAMIKIPEGFKQFLIVNSYNSNVPSQQMKTGILLMSIDTPDGQDSETVYIERDKIEALGKYEHNEMPPTLFKCKSDKYLFMLTHFSLNYNKQADKEIRLSIEGYLFQK